MFRPDSYNKTIPLNTVDYSAPHKYTSSKEQNRSKFHPGVDSHDMNNIDTSTESSFDFNPRGFTTYETTMFHKKLLPWARAKPILQELHQSSATNSIIAHSVIGNLDEIMDSNCFGGKTASMLLESSKRLPAHLRADMSDLKKYQEYLTKKQYRTTSNEIGEYAKEHQSKDSLSQTRKEIAHARLQHTQELSRTAQQEQQHTYLKNENVCKSRDYALLLASADTSKHVHSIAAEKKRIEKLSNQYGLQAKYALDVHTHLQDNTIEEIGILPNQTLGKQLTQRAPVKSLSRTNTSNLNTIGLQSMKTMQLEPHCKEHSIYQATPCDCEPTLNEKQVQKYNTNTSTSYPAGLYTKSAKVKRLKDTKSTVPSLQETQDAWHSRQGDREAWSWTMKVAKDAHMKQAGIGKAPPPLETAVRSDREKQYRAQVYPPDFKTYSLIKTNFSMPMTYENNFETESNAALKKPGFEPSYTGRHGKFGYLPPNQSTTK